MGQHYPDDMARKRQERRVDNREWRTEIMDELALLHRPVGDRPSGQVYPKFQPPPLLQPVDPTEEDRAWLANVDLDGPFVCSCGRHLPCRHCETP